MDALLQLVRYFFQREIECRAGLGAALVVVMHRVGVAPDHRAVRRDLADFAALERLPQGEQVEGRVVDLGAVEQVAVGQEIAVQPGLAVVGPFVDDRAVHIDQQRAARPAERRIEHKALFGFGPVVAGDAGAHGAADNLLVDGGRHGRWLRWGGKGRGAG